VPAQADKDNAPMANPIDSPEYWIEDFKPTPADLDLLYEVVLEAGRPFAIEELGSVLVRHHVRQALERRRAHASAGGTLYLPSNRYEAKQKLIFPALDGAEGVVTAVRVGDNPAYGAYDVIQVRLGSVTREFAAGLQWEHSLAATDTDVDPDALAERYDAIVAPSLSARLATDKDWQRIGGLWILKAMLPAVNTGHLNLAEAIIMLAGEPLPADQILTELDLDKSLPLATRVMALEAALSSDPRFRNVGAIEAPLWTVTTQLG
jgi:hypothetical protein